MEDWQERVIEERRELGVKLQKLDSFVGSVTFRELDVMDQSYLLEQQEYMQGYLDVLDARIRRFKGGTK